MVSYHYLFLSSSDQQQEQVNVYNNGYDGPSYSVKYLGIVDGTMGILSRKMAMPAQVATNPTFYKEVVTKVETRKYAQFNRQCFRVLNKVDLMAPVLGGKSYAQRMAALAVNNSLHQNQSLIENDSNAIVYSKKNSVDINESQDDVVQSSLQLQPKPLGQYISGTNQNGGPVEIINVKYKEHISSDYVGQFTDAPSQADGRKSVDKTGSHESPQPFMKSLMDHSSMGSPPQKRGQAKTIDRHIVGAKQSKLKANLKLTGKTIVEGNKHDLPSAIRAISKEGVQLPSHNGVFQMDIHSVLPQSETTGAGAYSKTVNSTGYQNMQQQQQLNTAALVADQDYYNMVQQTNHNERVSGYPQPQLYNQHYINKYSFPKGLQAMKKPDEIKKKNDRLSLYDIDQPQVRKGISGWKLTKRPIMVGAGLDTSFQQPESAFPALEMIKKTKRKRTKGARGGAVLVDGRRISLGQDQQEYTASDGEEGSGQKMFDQNGQIIRSVNQQDNQLTNIKISYHHSSKPMDVPMDQFSGEAQPNLEDPSLQFSPHGGTQDQINSFSNRHLANQYN